MAKSKTTRARRSAAEAKRAILDAAGELLAEHGIEGVQLKPIAAAAGITHSGVLHHFGSREGLLEALFQRQSAEMRAEIIADLARITPNMTRDEQLTEFVRVFERVAAPRRAPLLAWLIACGRDPLPPAERFGLREIADRIQAVREATSPGSAVSREDSLFRVQLAVLAMFGDLFVGGSTRRRLGVGDSERSRTEFRRRLGDLLLP